MDFPKYLKSNKTGRIGLNILSKIVEKELGWVTRLNHQEDDFGIDAFLDVIIDGYITGKSIAIQVKSGNSYFVSLDSANWKFKGEIRHLNYYLNHDIPVLIVLVNVDTEIAYWELCKIEYVDLHENSWTMPIPKDQQISSLHIEQLLNLVPKTVNYVSQLEDYWLGNKLLSDIERLLILVGKDDIKEMNYRPLIDLIKRICSNKYHLSKFKENIEIGICGFDDDSRELYQVPEVKKWMSNIFKHVLGLTYFVTKDKYSQFLKVLVFSCVEMQTIDKNSQEGSVWVEFDKKYLEGIFEIIFNDLNEFTDSFELSEQINKEISYNLVKCIMGSEPFEL